MSAQDGALREALERPIDYMTKDDMRAAIKALRAEHAALLAAVRALGAAQDQWQADGTRASRELAWQKLTTLRALVAAQGDEGGER
jgi:hypothetical protein